MNLSKINQTILSRKHKELNQINQPYFLFSLWIDKKETSEIVWRLPSIFAISKKKKKKLKP